MPRAAKKTVSQEAYNEYEHKVNLVLKRAWFEGTGYKPHDAQLEIHESAYRFKVAVNGRRFGKSLLAAKEIEPILMQPNKRIWVVAPTYTLTDKVFREIWQTFVLNRTVDPLFITKKSDNDRIIKFANGSEIIGKSADNPDSLLGEGLDYLVIDEAAKVKRTIWEKYLRPTLTDRRGHALFITSPEGKNWIYDLFLRGKDTNYPEWGSWSYPSWANPYLDAAEIAEAKDTLTDETFRQEYGAEFTTHAGLVYKDFDTATHVIGDLGLPKFVKYLFGIDYGFVNQTAILVIGVTKDDRFVALDESYKKGLSESDTVNELIRLREKYPDCNSGYGDQEDATKQAAVRRAGFKILRSVKDVAPGILTVAENFKIKKDGSPNILIHLRCSNIIRELETYRYADEKVNSNIKEIPYKKDDHAVDALRYVVHSYLKGFRPASIRGEKIF
jgi:PBSX family phage terminase large subunit